MLANVVAGLPPYLLSVYPEPQALLGKLAAFHGVGEDEILLTSGIDGGLKTMFEVVVEPGDLVGVGHADLRDVSVYAGIFQAGLC